MKVIKVLLVEVTIFIITIGLGFGIDYILIFSAEKSSEMNGHPVLVFTMFLPLLSVVIIMIINLLLIIIHLVKRRKDNG
ncbi:MAG: hypothetical protein K6G11_05635 [Lachnospiraceae bacterium]|nr:hypothetical protein [Lachnospiraceae bacterium]